MEENIISKEIIGAAIEVHRILGPGLMESAYQASLAQEFILRNLKFEKEKALPLEYKGTKLDCGYPLDFLVEGLVVVELKAVEKILPIHQAQLLTYMKLSNVSVGLLMNFNVKYLRDGIKRMVL